MMVCLIKSTCADKDTTGSPLQVTMKSFSSYNNYIHLKLHSIRMLTRSLVSSPCGPNSDFVDDSIANILYISYDLPDVNLPGEVHFMQYLPSNKKYLPNIHSLKLMWKSSLHISIISYN